MGILEESASAVGKVGKAIEGNPHGKKAIDYLAQSAEVVMHSVRNVLLPVAAVNFGIEKAKRYFEGKFASDLNLKLASVPAEAIVEPKAFIAGPAMQGLAYSFDEDALRELYLNLLRSSMDLRCTDKAHPAFVEVIRQLSSQEAELLRGFGSVEAPPRNFAVVQWRLSYENDSGWNILLNHFLDSKTLFEGLPIDPSAITRAVENWIRLGLVEVDYTSFLTTPSAYDWVDDYSDFEILRQNLEEGEQLVHEPGVLRWTEFGRRFYLIAVH